MDFDNWGFLYKINQKIFINIKNIKTVEISNNVKPLDEYVSIDSKGNHVIVFVFSKKDSQDVFIKFRNHELEIKDVIEV